MVFKAQCSGGIERKEEKEGGRMEVEGGRGRGKQWQSVEHERLERKYLQLSDPSTAFQWLLSAALSVLGPNCRTEQRYVPLTCCNSIAATCVYNCKYIYDPLSEISYLVRFQMYLFWQLDQDQEDATSTQFQCQDWPEDARTWTLKC